MPLPLLWVSLAFISGIVAASVLHLHLAIWLGLIMLALAGTLAAGRFLASEYAVHMGAGSLHFSKSLLMVACAALVFVMIGASRYQASIPSHSSSRIEWFNGGDYDVLVTGSLVEPPDERDTYTNLRVQTRSVETGDGEFPVRGLLLARLGPNQDLQYGDIVRLRGRLRTPPSNEEFSYRDYLARQGVHSYMSSAEATVLPGFGGNFVMKGVYGLREISLQKVYDLFLDPEASLLAGILLGVDTGMPGRLEQAFNNTGTSHIIAISGFNIAIIAGVFALVFNRLLGPRRGALAAFAGIVFYTVLVGADPAVVRAAIMGVVGLLAVQLGRRQTGLNTLAFVAAFMAFMNPFVLWDVGFQLSLFATLGLMLYGGPFMEAARGFIERRFPASNAQQAASVLGQFFLLTFAAQVTTLPITAYHFKQISLISPLANAFILPAQPLVMILGGLAVALGLLIQPLGQVVAWTAWPLTAYTIRLVEFFDALPHAVVYMGRLSLGLVVLFYAGLFAVTFGRETIKAAYQALRTRFRYLSIASVLVALFIGALFTWRLVASLPDGRLQVTFLDVGSADAVLIESPSGGHVLVNGGPSAAAASDALGRRLSPLDHRLDWLVLASTDENQVAGLPRLVTRYPPQNVLLGAPEQASFSAGRLMEWLVTEEVPLTRAENGQALSLGDGAMLKVIDVSTRGTTLLLEWKSFRLLLPIGANLDTLETLHSGSDLGPVNVLLLAESGYGPLSPPEWIQSLNPQLVVISVAAADEDGLPDPDTLETLQDFAVLRTDQNGWVEIATDGTQMWVSSERTQQPDAGDE